MNGDTILEIAYSDLREMLIEFQTDGLNADGCSCALNLDEDEEIQYAVKYGVIRVRRTENDNNRAN